MSESIQPNEFKEKEQKTLDALLVFGQGPILDQQTRFKAGEAKTIPGSEDINLWSKALAGAAAELYQKGQTREILLMGGRTGGPEYLSEADLIAKDLVERYHIPEAAIKREDTSTNTLENLVNVLNQVIDKKNPEDIGILGSDHHLSRIRVIMDLFDIPVNVGFSAESVLRAKAYEGDEWWKSPQLDELDKRLDIDSAVRKPVSEQDVIHGPKPYYQKQQGEEQKSIHARWQEEDLWTRALIEKPEYWLGYVGRLNNTDRIRTILGKQDQSMLQEKFGIDSNLDTDEELKAKLLAIKREVPFEWKGQDWPPQTLQKLEDIHASRKSKEQEAETKFTVLRHAPTQWNKEGRIQGNVDTNLDPDMLPKYVENIKNQNLSKPELIVVSGLRRSRQSADAIAKTYGWENIPVVVETELNERKWGVLEGLTSEEARAALVNTPEIIERYPELATTKNLAEVWDRPEFKVEGGESMAEVGLRCHTALQKIHADYPGKQVFMVSHAGVMLSLGLDYHAPQSMVIGK